MGDLLKKAKNMSNFQTKQSIINDTLNVLNVDKKKDLESQKTEVKETPDARK